jgi:hypothetical protein
LNPRWLGAQGYSQAANAAWTALSAIRTQEAVATSCTPKSGGATGSIAPAPAMLSTWQPLPPLPPQPSPDLAMPRIVRPRSSVETETPNEFALGPPVKAISASMRAQQAKSPKQPSHPPPQRLLTTTPQQAQVCPPPPKHMPPTTKTQATTKTSTWYPWKQGPPKPPQGGTSSSSVLQCVGPYFHTLCI